MIGQLASIVKRRSASKRDHSDTTEESCIVLINHEGSIVIRRTQCLVPDVAVRRSVVLRHISAAVGEAVPLPISEPIFRCWVDAVGSGRSGFLCYDAEEFSMIMTVLLSHQAVLLFVIHDS